MSVSAKGAASLKRSQGRLFLCVIFLTLTIASHLHSNDQDIEIPNYFLSLIISRRRRRRRGGHLGHAAVIGRGRRGGVLVRRE
jgi:hypothetical protein